MQILLTARRLHELLNYDPDTGIFTWRVKRSGTARAGCVAGSKNNIGYLVISIDNKPYKAHRLAWLWMHAEWPSKAIDHINQVKSDNRLCNLREASISENSQNRPMFRNNTSGFRGVHWHKQARRWRAYIRVNGKQYSIGCFATAEEAFAAYKNAASRLHTHNPEAGQ